MSDSKKSVYMVEDTLRFLNDMAARHGRSVSVEIARAVEHQAALDYMHIDVSPLAGMAMAIGRYDLIQAFETPDGWRHVSIKPEAIAEPEVPGEGEYGPLYAAYDHLLRYFGPRNTSPLGVELSAMSADKSVVGK